MHPSPMADTSRLLFPSLRFCIVSPFRRSVLGAGVAESHLMAARAKMVPSLPPINPEPRMPTRMLLSLPLQLLARGPEQDFVHARPRRQTASFPCRPTGFVGIELITVRRTCPRTKLEGQFRETFSTIAAFKRTSSRQSLDQKRRGVWTQHPS